MTIKIAFGILSSYEPEYAVRQLVESLGDRDPIIVHHDYSKQPGFSLSSTRARLISDYVPTQWGSADFTRALFHLMRTALRVSRFDYFQLLSASCLPLRPVDELRRHLAVGQHPIYSDILNLDTHEGLLMSHGHRVLCRVKNPASYLLNRSRRWYLGDDPVTVQQGNLSIAGRSNPNRPLTVRQRLGRKIHEAARRGLLDDHPFRGDTAPFVGSLWFCLRRDVCEYLVRQEESNPLTSYLMSLKACDEILFPTLLGNLGCEAMPSNHLVSDFVGSHPRLLDMDDLPMLAASDKFFARKFRLDTRDRVRQCVLAQGGHLGQRSRAQAA